MSLDKFIPKKTSRRVQQPLRKKLVYLGAMQRGKKRGRKR